MFKSGSSKINVDREKLNDPMYRYKMAPVILKDEGAGNGLVTILVNLDEIANDINRDPFMIMTYLASVLGCKQEQKNNKWILCGRFMKETIQNNIYDFISYFVLCKCKNPETDFVVEKNNITLKCRACSQLTDIFFNKHTMKVLKLVAKQN
jgi:translation initiation factor 2 beta subunit (eIF-2beta)/eIF-5